MKKQFLLFFLALLPMMAMADDSGSCGDNVTWTYTESTKTLTIQGSGAMYDFDNQLLWFWESYDVKTIVIGDGVTTIGNHAFTGCFGLTSVIIPNSVTSIGNRAFANCHGLTSIIIPSSVTNIDEEAFWDALNLTSIIVENGNNIYDSRDNCNAIIESASNTLIRGCKTTTIPENVTSIGNGAFIYCRGLTDIKIPNSITTIGDGAFAGCSGLTSITIPNSVKSIGESAFSNCSGITSVSIGNSVTSIGGSAFFGCPISSIVIPNSVTSIGAQAFSGCRELTSIYSKIENVFTIDSDTFNRSIYENATLYVPAGKSADYRNTKAWYNFYRIIEYDYSTGIAAPQQGKDVKIVDSYLLNGQKINAMQHGLNIIIKSDGTARKVMLK